MAAINGRLAKVMYGNVKISGLSTWTMSGYETEALDDTEFGDTVMSFVFGGAGNPGTVTFAGLYDPADSNGQEAFATACKNEVYLTNLYFYETATKYWAVAPGGKIIPTKCDSIAFDKNTLAQVDFAGQVSGTVMTRYGT